MNLTNHGKRTSEMRGIVFALSFRPTHFGKFMRLATIILFALSSNLSVASEPELTANLIVTSEGSALFEAWSANPADGLSIRPVDVAERGKFLTAAVLFKGCATNDSGNCNALLDITALDPSGKVYGKFEDRELWVDKPAPKAGYTQLGVSYMGLVIEPEDPSGQYKVIATVRDVVSGEQVVAEAEFRVEPLSDETR